MDKFARLTSPSKIYYTLTYFLLDRYFFLIPLRNRAHLNKKSRRDISAISQKNRRELVTSAKISRGGGRGISGIFPRIMFEISRSRKGMREEVHKKKVRKVGHLRKNNKGLYLSNFPATIRRANKNEESWASQTKLSGIISTII